MKSSVIYAKWKNTKYKIDKCIVSSPPYMQNSSLGSLQMDARA